MEATSFTSALQLAAGTMPRLLRTRGLNGPPLLFVSPGLATMRVPSFFGLCGCSHVTLYVMAAKAGIRQEQDLAEVSLMAGFDST